jgi:hypothetical protein
VNIVEARHGARNTRPSRVIDSDYYPFDGGLNLVATPLQLRPGELIGCLNYEISPEGGYARAQGFERYDGRLAPSDAQYYLISFNAGTPGNYPTAGQAINGQTSGATAVALAAPVESSSGVGYVVVGRVSGAFATSENLRVSTTVFGVATSTALASSAPTDELNDAYQLLAQADARSQIAAVPGSGPVRGVAVYRGKVYAVRDNGGATAAGFYVESSTGWQAVSDYPLLRFTAGTSEIFAGDTVTGGTSTHSAVVRRVVLQSGSWGASTAAGFLILAPGAPTFANGESLLVSASPRATASGTAAAPTRPPGGKYEFRVHNFYGHSSSTRLYGVNGVGKAFEIQDGASGFYCPVETGMTTDTPNHLGVHKGYLWLSFPGGSVQKSGAADPVAWSVVTGAAEYAMGDEVTGFLEEIAKSMFVFCRNRTVVMVGDGPEFVPDTFAAETGAREWTMQRIGRGIFLDDRGFSTLAAAQTYGNFSSASISARVTPMMRDIQANLSCSSVARARNLYRLFLDDGRFISIGYRNDKVVGFTACDLGKTIHCATSGEDASGRELSAMGASDGFVYRMDSGVNFDGGEVGAFFRLPFHYSKAPSREKKYRKADFDIRLQGKCSLQIAPEYSYARTDVQSDPVKNVQLIGGGAFWNVGFWNQFNWSANPVASAAVKLNGSGSSIGFLIAHTSSNEPPHTLQGVKMHLSYRRLNREALPA